METSREHGIGSPTMTIQELFLLGMKRRIPTLPMPSPLDGKPVLNVGAGNHQIPGTTPIDLPRYNADTGPLPYETESIGGIHAYHFLEHVEEPVWVLQDFQRVLVPGGVAAVGVPHACSMMAFNDMDHKTFFTEKSFPYLLGSKYYDKHSGMNWEIALVAQFIMGIKASNLMLFAIFKKKSGTLFDEPVCIVCGSITVRSGEEFKCLNCGHIVGTDESEPSLSESSAEEPEPASSVTQSEKAGSS